MNNNVLRVLELSLRFQDGKIIDVPVADALPEAVDLSGLLQSQQSVTYYATLPSFKPFGGNFAAIGQTVIGARHQQANSDTPDLYTQAAHTMPIRDF